ncbi:iron complex outermembrane receptor protein [Pseudoduganella flava]|uniref:Iron complex outermembrane receptor protein n=1 Tax=Pseudoduganella flava TaxID=871742 RepID=A0A562PVQ9_9BURK|nr:TonB-dependent receptor [Pseudoduganella flava]QGZ39631.1 TonB-dependent receptor [Pseudoduganella flava]TWI48531.1 iron complex outermembrane receptor protein [Pseudoduganella flava]
MNKHPTVQPRFQPKLAMTSIALAVLAVANGAAAQDAAMQRVEVTGSSIKRLANEEALPVTSIKAEEFTQRGMTTLADVMMALPQSASLAPSNAGSGTNINLRGLGVNRTLVLLNGRRLANEAISAGYANLDVIPFSALQRVEILRDGASSLYGSDAIGGVVNFITKKEFEGVQVTGQYVTPEKSGGGDERRATLTFGKGSLNRDGWSAYATVDFHDRSRLAAKDRADLSSEEVLNSLGRSRVVGSGGYAMPANFTTATNKTAQNPYAGKCTPPYSMVGAKNTCIIDSNEYGTALYENEQISFYARAAKQISEDHTFTVEYTRGQSQIISVRNPTQSVAVNGVSASLPSSSKWYPGNSGGVPAMAGITGQPLTVTWSVADYGLAAQKDKQVNQRLAFVDEGKFGEWDYRGGLVIGLSDRENYYQNGFFRGQGILDGLKSGALNPFGLQDQAGLDYLKSISVDGEKNRDSRTTYKGLDFSASRMLFAMAGGDAAIAVGADMHRETTRDDKLAIQNEVQYLNSTASHGEGGRNVYALYTELDLPVTKTLNVNLAVRDDYFSDVGNTINPKASFRWQPTKTVMFRGSANTGFRAPTLFDAYGYRLPGATGKTSSRWDDPLQCPSATPAIAGTGKPLPGLVESEVCNVQLNKQVGSNPNLKPEKSRGFTLGVVLEPTKSLTMSFDYWNIRMKDMLANLPEQVYFQDPVKYAYLFARNADGSLAYINNTTMNLGGQKAAGIDVSATYRLPRNDYGDFKVELDGTYLTQFDNQLFPGEEWVSNVGRFGNASNGTTSSFPIITYRWKHVLKLGWAKGDWTAQATQNYNSKYEDQNLVAQQYWRDINSYKPWNLTVGYKGFKNTVLTFGVTNVFDSNPPRTNHSGYSYGYLSSAASPIGRAYNLRAQYTF